MAEQEYADFSDMQNPELPDSLPENESEPSHLTFGYDENTSLEGKEETQKEEIEEVKPQQETSPKEDPSQNPYWQSKYDKDVLPVKQENEKLRQEIEAIKSQLNPPKKEEPLIEPRPPQSDDPLDEIRYLKEYMVYRDKLNEQRLQKQDQYFQQVESERQARIQQEEMARQRAWQVSQLSQAGLSPEEANQALAEFSKAAETPEQYFKDLAEFYKFKKGQFSPKTSKVEQRASRQGALPPLGIVPSETEPQNVDPADAFFSDMQGFIKRNY